LIAAILHTGREGEPTDDALERFFNGTTVTALIHDMFGNGIMSALDERTPIIFPSS
jgi:cyanate lyase